jgi:uncharacterized protein (TIGR02266 family)
MYYWKVDLCRQDMVNNKAVERRINSRIPISLEVTFDSGEQVLSSYLFDMGEGGIFIGTPDPLEDGSPIRLCFHLPGMSNSLLVMGTVIWRQGSGDSSRPGMGIKFDDISSNDRERLDAFLMEQLTN